MSRQLSLLDVPTLARFQAKVQVDPETGCWLWQGARKTAAHYGEQPYSNIRVGTRVMAAHRFAYETLVGPLPAGCELDHLCRNRQCVNPAHLQPVSHRENVQRGVLARRWQSLGQKI